MSFTYEGTRLTGITVNYDNETTTYYYYEGNKLITEYRNDNDRIDFLYDTNELLYGFINNKTDRYYYVRDILQNILGIVDSNGNLIVKYDCNAYGELESITGNNTQLALRNPFRYKGYYYDEETGLFWCNSRYYNPEWGRWLTPDSIEYLEPDNINGLNLYCYCQNNPIMYIDYTGQISIPVMLIVFLGLDKAYRFFIKVKKGLVPHSLPRQGDPNFVGKQTYSDGTPYRERVYGPDGNAVIDHDHHPGEEVGFNHDHVWNGEERGPAQKPTESNDNTGEKIAAAVGLVATGLSLVWLVGNDVTGVGAADDAAIPAAVTTFVGLWCVLFS